MVNTEYIRTIISNFLQLSNKKIRLNKKLQQLYDSNNYYELLILLQEFNLTQPVPYLACGMSNYFNSQVEELGLSGLKISVTVSLKCSMKRSAWTEMSFTGSRPMTSVGS